MADDKPVYLTESGLQELQQELEQLRVVRRPEVAARIGQAKEYGDISENAEYEDAKNEQAFMEGRIRTIENLLNRARLIKDDPAPAGGGVVRLGSRVTVTPWARATAPPTRARPGSWSVRPRPMPCRARSATRGPSAAPCWASASATRSACARRPARCVSASIPSSRRGGCVRRL